MAAFFMEGRGMRKFLSTAVAHALLVALIMCGTVLPSKAIAGDLKNSVMSLLDYENVTISSGSSVSPAILLGGLRLFGIVMPAEWTAANLTFQASVDGGATWVDWIDSKGAEHYITPVAGKGTPIDPTAFAAVPMLRLRSGTAALPVNQAADRTITLILRSY